MIATIIASLGIGFMLGLLYADKILINPLKASLMKIRAFGYKQSGYGYSCARMADETLKKQELEE